MVCLSQQAYDKYKDDIKEGGVVLVDEDLVSTDKMPEVDVTMYKIPFTRIASEEIKLPIVANIVMLGALTRLTNIVSKESMEKAILDSVPKGTEEKNLLAFSKGYEVAKEL